MIYYASFLYFRNMRFTLKDLVDSVHTNLAQDLNMATDDAYIERLLDVFGENPSSKDIKDILLEIFENPTEMYQDIWQEIKETLESNNFISSRLLFNYLSHLADRLGILVILWEGSCKKQFLPQACLPQGRLYYTVMNIKALEMGSLVNMDCHLFEDTPPSDFLSDKSLFDDMTLDNNFPDVWKDPPNSMFTDFLAYFETDGMDTLHDLNNNY